MPKRTNDYERLGGFRAVLKSVPLLNLVRSALGRSRVTGVLATEFIQAKSGDSVVDLGCGLAGILPFLDDVSYVGVDADAECIATVSRRFEAKGRFVCADLLTMPASALPAADLVLIRGFLHHLDDGHARAILKLAGEILKPEGRLVTIDPVRTKQQNPIAKLLVSMDRGPYVRYAPAYRALIEAEFGIDKLVTRTDLLRLPYSHCISVSRPKAAPEPEQASPARDRKPQHKPA